jgi:hypothetical protein
VSGAFMTDEDALLADPIAFDRLRLLTEDALRRCSADMAAAIVEALDSGARWRVHVIADAATVTIGRLPILTVALDVLQAPVGGASARMH